MELVTSIRLLEILVVVILIATERHYNELWCIFLLYDLLHLTNRFGFNIYFIFSSLFMFDFEYV